MTSDPVYVTVEVPPVNYKGPNDTDPAIYRRAAENLDGDYSAGGSNVRAAIALLLRRVAIQLESTECIETVVGGRVVVHEIVPRGGYMSNADLGTSPKLPAGPAPGVSPVADRSGELTFCGAEAVDGMGAVFRCGLIQHHDGRHYRFDD